MTATGAIGELAEKIKRTEPYMIVTVSDDRSRVIALRQSLTGFDIIAGCDEHGCNEVYSYGSLTVAYLAIDAWSGNKGTEPTGWIRHMPSGRRRPDGDPKREHIAP